MKQKLRLKYSPHQNLAKILGNVRSFIFKVTSKLLFYRPLSANTFGFNACSSLSRPVGFDISKGEKILSRGDLLGPAELGLLATAGVQEVTRPYMQR